MLGNASKGVMRKAKRKGWAGVWEEAQPRGKQGRSGGIATLVRAPVPIFRTPVGKEGRWHSVVVPWLNGVALHVYNVYGWGSAVEADLKNDEIGSELEHDIGTLGRAPWLAGGDWSRTLEQAEALWADIGTLMIKKTSTHQGGGEKWIGLLLRQSQGR